MIRCPPITRRHVTLAALSAATCALALSWAPASAFAADRMVIGEHFTATW